MLKGRTKDLQSGRYQITLEMLEGNIQETDSLQGKELIVELKRFFKKRTNKANRLLWECIGQIAADTGKKNWDVYIDALVDYGQYTTMMVWPDAIPKLRNQWREQGLGGGKYREIVETGYKSEGRVEVLCYFGSHTYNTKEFSQLLDGVISDMKDLGLPTPTGEEMQRTLAKYEEEQNGKEAI